MSQEFKNLREVAGYLKEQGYQTAQSTIYKHGREGLLRPNRETGMYSLKGVLRYAGKYLKQKATGQKIEDEELRRETERLQKELLKVRLERETLKKLKEERGLIERSLFDLELASRAAVLETGLKGMIQARAGEFVMIVDGDERKTGDLARELMAALDEALNEFATTKEFEVIFQIDQKEN